MKEEEMMTGVAAPAGCGGSEGWMGMSSAAHLLNLVEVGKRFSVQREGLCAR